MSAPEVRTADARGSRFSSIRAQLLTRFLLIALVPVLLLTLVAAEIAWELVRQLALTRLDGIAHARSTALETFANERLRALASVARAPGFVASCRSMADAFGGDAALDRVDPLDYIAALRTHEDFLRNFEDSFAAGDLLLVSPKGRIIYCSRQPSLVGQTMTDLLWLDSNFAATFDSVVRVTEPALAPADAPRAGRSNSSFTLGPILEGNQLVGIVAIEIPQREIETMVSEHAGLGQTGQVIIAAPLGDRWVSVGPMRNRADAAFHVPIPPGHPLAARIESAADGRDGASESRGLDGEDVLAAWTYVPSFGWALTAEQSTEEAYAVLRRLRDAVLWIFAVIVINVIAIAILTAKRFSRPLGEAVDATRRIAHGDLTTTPTVTGRGETRELLSALRDTNVDLAALVGRIKAAAGQIVTSSGTVRGVAQEQDQVVRDFASSSAQVAAATNEMSATSKELSATVMGLARAAEFAASTAGSGRIALVDLSQQMMKLNTGGRGVAERLQAIREKAGRIDTMVGAITKVANQTNLLSVNAAIEAEKAGAAGQGFQVVAREIDRLATQTAANVLEIEEVVIAVQQAVTEGVLEIGQFAETVNDGCGTADGVANQMGQIIRQSEELRAEFEQVAHAVSAQSEGVAQVNEAMVRLVEGARRTADAVERSSLTSGALDEAAKTLELEIARFRLPA